MLGDHLCEKSVTVKWIDVSLPHKRNCRLKDHKVLKDMANDNPETEDIFEDNLIDSQRPRDLENICLYDFVANYEGYGRNDNGDRKYSKLTKPRLQTINCLILKRKIKEKITTTLSYCSLFLLQMRVVCFCRRKQQRKLLIASYSQIVQEI